ncbi:MAG: betaine/proline/choline family ABC transporter ATP-binding protein [Erysipelotrichaceae bacterium]
MIEFKNVIKKYGKRQILKGINFEINEGEFVVLIGPSGCGKTTTLKSINRLIEPDGGQIFVDGRDTSKVDKVKLRRGIGYVIQQIGLFPHMSVEDNILVVPRLLKFDKEKCRTIVRDLLELVDMEYDIYAKKYPHEMSGGQQQRIGVLRALAGQPDIILMDEPFGALDPMTRTSLQKEMKRIQRKLNKTVIFVTHDMDEALKLADKIIFMEEGEIAQIATPDEILKNPATEMIKEFMGSRIENVVSNELYVKDVLRKSVFTTGRDTLVNEAIRAMDTNNIDSLVVTTGDNRFIGVVDIDKLLANGVKPSETIEKYLDDDVYCASIEDEAKLCFDKLLHSGRSYVIVLEDNKVAGIVTKTTMVKALAKAMWSEE